MTFADIPPGASLFVDANTLVYHFAADPLLGPPCRELLHRIRGGAVFRGWLGTQNPRFSAWR